MHDEYLGGLGPVKGVSVSRRRVMAPPKDRESALPVEGEQVSRLTDLLVSSCEETGLQEKDAARSQGYDPKYWPRIKSGEKAAHLDKIAGLPLKTQREFVTRWARMLKMRVSDDDSQKRALLQLVRAATEALDEIA